MKKCGSLRISLDGRKIVKEDNSPFFWLGDTAWEIFHKLKRDEAIEYLTVRAAQQFNVIQATILAEFDGLNTPNAYGRIPLLKNDYGNYDPLLPDVDKSTDTYTYWDHVDFIIDTAASLGLYIGLLPTWGDKFNKRWGKGPQIFTPENAYLYGQWLGKRYKDRDNIIWIMGGDRPLENAVYKSIIRNMAAGVKAGAGSKCLFTFHPTGFKSSSMSVHNEAWLDFNMIQSGHGDINIKNYEFVRNDYSLSPVKPVIDGEPRYEDHPIKFNSKNGYFDDYDVRVAAYWAVLSGAFGHTYGHHSIWSFNTEITDKYIMSWKDAMYRPGVGHMKYMKELFTSRAFAELVPCQDLVKNNYEGANYIAAAKGKNYAFFYTPNGLEIEVTNLSGNIITSAWFDPRKGTYIFDAIQERKNIIKFTPPSAGRNNDWVLVLDMD